MIRLSPVLRISLALASLTASILLIAGLIGLVPERTAAILDARKKICESLAVQLSLAATRSEVGLIRATMQALVERNIDVLSGAIRTADGVILTETGEHSRHWVDISDAKSTPTHVKVPIFKGDERWGTVEVSFRKQWYGSNLEMLKDSVYGLAIFVALSGFIGYFVIIRKALRELDPASVIPERVKAAFDTLSEGVLILDEREHIVLANAAFAKNAARAVSSLVGYKASELKWHNSKDKVLAQDLPWTKALSEGRTQTRVPLSLSLPNDGVRNFSVNGAPILDDKGANRGVLVTFDDVTEIERKNAELRSAVMQLKTSEREVKRKNQILHRLATRDPLTECVNRRALFEAFESLFYEAKRDGLELSCIMTDIDHFKSVNDNYGHAVGDEAIKFMADLLQSRSREHDIVSRYGGEEFCILLPGLNDVRTTAVAERIRQAVQEQSNSRFTSGLQITASFGVSSLRFGAEDPAELLSQADQALYWAKQGGRNRVSCWDSRQTQGSEKTAASKASELDNGRTPNKPRSGHTNDAKVYQLPQPTRELEWDLGGRPDEPRPQHGGDTVPGLPNRLLFCDRIKQAIAQGQRYKKISALLSMRIEVVKQAGEPYGPEVDHEVLKRVSQRLASILRCTDTVVLLGPDKSPPTVSRLGNDEFGILLTELEDAESVTWVVKRISDGLSARMEVAKREVQLGTTIGISIFPYDGDTPEDLLKNANTARDHAKDGRKRYWFHSREANERASEQICIEDRLRRAIEHEEFVLHYQPMVDVAKNRITSFEALIRWEDPHKGLIAPSEFIPVAERTGLINTIGKWVLQTACEQAKAWVETGFPDLRIAVNLSPAQFQQRGLTHEVRTILDETGLDPHHLELEITEGVIMLNIDAAILTMQELADMGVNLAIDDFGTGYSSLSYLRMFPVDSFKIDRSFLQDVFTDARCKGLYGAIAAIARSLGLKIVAEGIETQAQLAFVREMQCDEMQGYLLSKPVPAQAAADLLQNMTKLLPTSSLQLANSLCLRDATAGG